MFVGTMVSGRRIHFAGGEMSCYFYYCLRIKLQINSYNFYLKVCKATVQELENAISKEDPNKTVDVSGFRLDAKGNSISKSVKLVKSEMYLTELMEKICK